MHIREKQLQVKHAYETDHAVMISNEWERNQMMSIKEMREKYSDFVNSDAALVESRRWIEVSDLLMFVRVVVPVACLYNAFLSI